MSLRLGPGGKKLSIGNLSNEGERKGPVITDAVRSTAAEAVVPRRFACLHCEPWYSLFVMAQVGLPCGSRPAVPGGAIADGYKRVDRR
ncbi:hypothetical protein D3C76_1154130 [compost metagenome]